MHYVMETVFLPMQYFHITGEDSPERQGVNEVTTEHPRCCARILVMDCCQENTSGYPPETSHLEIILRGHRHYHRGANDEGWGRKVWHLGEVVKWRRQHKKGWRECEMPPKKIAMVVLIIKVIAHNMYRVIRSPFNNHRRHPYVITSFRKELVLQVKNLSRNA